MHTDARFGRDQHDVSSVLTHEVQPGGEHQSSKRQVSEEAAESLTGQERRGSQTFFQVSPQQTAEMIGIAGPKQPGVCANLFKNSL